MVIECVESGFKRPTELNTAEVDSAKQTPGAVMDMILTYAISLGAKDR